ncbi:MAG: pyrroline-5-carboxylate reductase [Bacteroidota bacterium]|jgi:pyrroline-5-carboxylate reductase
MSNQKIAILGGGNLGASIAEGLIASGFIQASEITISKRNIATIQHLADKGATITSNNEAAVKDADYIILAVKPFQVNDVVNAIKPALVAGKHTVISVATGVWIKDLEELLSPDFALFRAMPNTAIAIQQSMTCICANANAKDKVNYVLSLFDQLGKSIVIDEKLMDAATVLGACGTAYALRYIRANIQGGIEIGFNAAQASLIAAQTVKGAADLLLTKNTHPEQEIDKVTTPMGCTIAGLNEMEHQGFSSSLIRGLTASYRKIKDDM